MGQLDSCVCNTITGYITANIRKELYFMQQQQSPIYCGWTTETDKENGVGEINTVHG